jgi:hypothetical protein
VSLDAPTAAANDAVRGRGAFAGALAAIRRLDARGLHPIVTAVDDPERAPGSLYAALRAVLVAGGVTRPRVKILPLLRMGRAATRGPSPRLTAVDVADGDAATLPCSASRVVAAGGVYACPILAGLPNARLAAGALAAALVDTPLYHPVCVACRETGITCRNA